jgi:molybdopterin converting factor small subunit
MPVRIELYGLARSRADCAELVVEGETLAAALAAACAARPGLQACSTRDGRLRPGYIANLNGDHFISDPATPLPPGTTLLLLSSDAGG